MTPRTEPLPTFDGVGSGDKATCDLELGRIYRRLWLEVYVAAGDKTFDEIIEDIFLNVNERPQRSHTAVELNELNQLHDDDGAVKTSGTVAGGDYKAYVPIILAETYRKNVERGLALGWNAVGIRSLQLQVKLRAGLTSPTLKGWMDWEPGDLNRGLGPITKWIRHDLSATASPQDYSRLFDQDPRTDNFLQSLHIWPTSGTARYVSEAELKFNGTLFHERTYLRNQAELLANGMNPDLAAVPRYDAVIDETDSTNDPLNLRAVTSHNLKLTFNAAPSGNLRIISQETGLPK